MNEVAIRVANLDDASAIAHLMSQLGYPTSTDEMTARLKNILAATSYMTFVAEIHQEVVGVIGISIGFAYEANAVYGRLLALSIDETYRRQGIGAALVEQAENWLKEHDVDSVVVSSRKQRHEAHSFYKRLDYEETGLRFVKSLSSCSKNAAAL